LNRTPKVITPKNEQKDFITETGKGMANLARTLQEVKMDNINTNENVLEWLTGQKEAGVTASQKKLVNRIRRLHEENPDEVVLINNADGSIYAKIPTDWIRIKKPTKKELTEEERREMAEVFRARIGRKDEQA
jgi:hypothetical protein